jgi:hypothetical protein
MAKERQSYNRKGNSSRLYTQSNSEVAETIDVANISDDIYYDRRNLRDSLGNNNGHSFLMSSDRSSSAASSQQQQQRYNSYNSCNSSSSRSQQQHDDQIAVDIPNLKSEIVLQTSDNINKSSTELQTSTQFSYVRKTTLDDASHLDWDGDIDDSHRTDDDEKGTSIIVHDNEEEGGRRKQQQQQQQQHGRRGLFSSSQKQRSSNNNESHKSSRRVSLGLDMPTFGKVQSRRSSWTFESIWQEGMSATSINNTDEDDSMYSNSAGSGSKVERMSSRGGRTMKKCLYRFKSYGTMLLLCVGACVVLSAMIGVLVAMIPLWIQSEERGESGEVGGLAYGDGNKGVLMDSSTSNSSNSSGAVLAATEKENPAASMSSFVLDPPPYNLANICKKESLLKTGGYEKCVSACFPSRCCLIDESKPYEVWTLHIGLNDIDEIGKSISSCFQDNKDMCIRYKQECSVLGKHSLLPVKPPSSKEVLAMNNKAKLALAEDVIRACSPREDGSTERFAKECQSFCEAKECCFHEDKDDEETVRVTDTDIGASSILPSPNITEGNNTTIASSENNSTRKVLKTKQSTTIEYCGNDPQQFCVTYAGCELYFQAKKKMK